jgi:hypothetical protein
VNRRSLVGPGEQGVLRATNVHNSRHIYYCDMVAAVNRTIQKILEATLRSDCNKTSFDFVFDER